MQITECVFYTLQKDVYVGKTLQNGQYWEEWMIQYNGEIKKIRCEETFDDLVSTIIPFDKQDNKQNIMIILLYILLFWV